MQGVTSFLEVNNQRPSTTQLITCGLAWCFMLILLSLAFIDNINTRDRLNTTLDFFLMSAVVTYCVFVFLKDSPRNILIAKLSFVIICCVVSETIAYWLPLSRFRPGESRSFTYGMISGLIAGLAIRLASTHFPCKWRFSWTRPRVLFSLAGAFTACYAIRVALQLAFDSYRNPRSIMAFSTFDYPFVLAISYVGITLWIQRFIKSFWGRGLSVLLTLVIISGTLQVSLPSHSGFRNSPFIWVLGGLSAGVSLMWFAVAIEPTSKSEQGNANWNLVAAAWIVMSIIFGGVFYGYTTYRVDHLLRGEIADAKFHQRYQPYAIIYLDKNWISASFEEGKDHVANQMLNEYIDKRPNIDLVSVSNASPTADFAPLSKRRLARVSIFKSSLTWNQLNQCCSSGTTIYLRSIDYESFAVPENATQLRVQNLGFHGDHDVNAVKAILENLDENIVKDIELPGNFKEAIPIEQLKKRFPKTSINIY